MGTQALKGFKKTLVKGYLSSTAAGTTYSDKIDMANFDGVAFDLAFGTTAGSTGTATFSVVGTDTSTAASTSYAALTGFSASITATTAGTVGKFASIEVTRPQYRYLKAKLVRVGKVRVQSIMATQSGPRYEPVTHSSSTLKVAVVSAVHQAT